MDFDKPFQELLRIRSPSLGGGTESIGWCHGRFLRGHFTEILDDPAGDVWMVEVAVDAQFVAGAFAKKENGFGDHRVVRAIFLLA